MELNIYSRTGALRLTVVPEDNAAESCGVEEQSTLSLSFTSFTCVALEVYDYVDFQGRRYWVTERYVPQMNARKLWAYSLRLGGIEALAAQTLMVNTADADNPEWTLAAPAREHAAMIVANLNRKTGTTEWKVGEVAVTDTIEIDYSGKYASDALTEVAEAATTEWWFDGVTLNFTRCEFGDPVPLAYGDGLLGGISRTTADGVKFFTRLSPLGSTRNIDPDRYGHARLQLPDGAHYVEQDTHLGIVEHYEQAAFEEIYPRRVGTVSTTLRREVTGDDGVKYKIYHFDDRSLPFNPNDYELPQKVKQVTFQSGELRGRTFEVNFDPDWDSGMFEIVTQWPYEDKSIQVPGPGLEPKPGDQYVIWNIRMPDEYYPLAEAEYREAVDRFMAENRKDLAVFQADTDFTVIDRRGLDLRPGQRVRLVSAEMFPETGFRDTRIVSISRNVLRPGSMTLRMSDVLATGRISRIESNIASVERLTKQVSSEFPDLIRSWEETPSSDTTLYTSRKSDREFLSKRAGGTVDGPVEFRRQVTHDGPDVFREQVTLDQGLRTADFAAGLTGAGGRIDGAGNGELESLFIRRFLEVPQLNYNRVEISVGDSWSAPGGGTIEQVDTETHLATLRLEEGEVGTLRAGDICMGIFHSLDTGENALQDTDDSRGNIAFAGFATVYFRVEEVLGEHNEQFRYSLRPVSESFTTSVEPMAAMSVVTYGSFTDPARRTSMYTTRTYQRYLRNVQTWEYGLEQIAAQFGDLSNLSVLGLQMEGYSAYVDNLYMQGVLRNLTGNFLIDSRTQSLLMASTDSGMGLAFNPEHGLKIGSVYDPETGRFQKEYDLDLIERTASEAQQAAQDAQTAAKEAQQSADNAASGVNSLKNFSDNAFADGVVSRAEAAAIEKYINSVTETKEAVDAAYTAVYVNPLLAGTAKSNLQAAKSTFDTAVADLLASIRTASNDGKATSDEKNDVDAKYSAFNIAYGAFSTRLEESNKYIQTAINTTAQGAYQLSQELRDAVNNLTESIIPDLQDQIDKQIVSYNGTDIPTLSNYPANEWTTDTERARHVNDYYDRKITDSDGVVSYERYKFTQESGVYKWVRIADSGAAEAQAQALEALGVANGKNKVYFGDSTPAVPYNINDVWIKTDGVIYLSNAERKDGATGSISDWQIVNDAQLRLRQMSSDGVISKEEKATLRNRLVQMQKEYASYQSDATTYGVSISALQTAYTNLVTFLTGTVAVNNDTDTTLTTAQHTTYNTYFAAYDAEVSRFTNLVADAIAQGKVDAVQVGGVNLLDGSQTLESWYGGAKAVVEEFNGYPSLVLRNVSGPNYGRYTPVTSLSKGGQYMASVWVWASRSLLVKVGLEGNSFNYTIPADKTEQWIRVSFAQTNSNSMFVCYAEVTTSDVVAFRNAQLEEGNKLTSWKPSIADTQTQIDNLTYLRTVFAKDETVIAGGAVIGSFVGVKNDSGTVVAGLAGKDFLTKSGAATFAADLTCPMFFAGATSATAANSAKFRVYADGSAFAKQMTLEDGCTAGGFLIKSGYISTPEKGGTFPLTLYATGLIDARRVGKGSQFGFTYFGNTDGTFFAQTSDGKYAGLALLGSGNSTLAGILINMTASAPAIEIRGGYVRGLRRYTKTISGSTTLTNLDDDIIISTGSSITITLPSSPSEGQEFTIYKTLGGTLTINGNGIYIERLSVSGGDSIQISDAGLCMKLKYASYRNAWYLMLQNGKTA